MGEVYLAIDEGPRGPRQVAIKRVLPSMSPNESIMSSFLDELRLAPRLNHANIVRTLDHGQAEEMYYMAMEYIDGRNLSELVGRAVKTGRSIGFAAALQIVHDICAGTHYAHTLADSDGTPLGIVHRDLSPRNVMVTTDGMAKVLDFGVAKARTQTNNTLPGVVKGTPSYLAPEQLAGASPAPMTDIFAMGIVLFELTTLRRLFRRGTVMETMRAILRCEVPPPGSLVPEYPEVIETIVLRALSRRPQDRYQTALEMRLAIVGALAELRATGEARAEVARLVRDLSDPPPIPVEPEEVTQVEESAVSVSVSLEEEDGPRHNLTEPDGPLIGRDRALSDLARIAEQARIVTLWGPPGAGKTRLAVELARALLSRASDEDGGAWLCELDSAESEADVVSTVGAILGLPVESSESVAEAFGEALEARGPVLIILDGVERVVEATCRLVTAWAAAAPEARFVITCREHLKLADAADLEVPPLDLEESNGDMSPAVALFLDRARHQVEGFEPDKDQLAAIRRIVRHLDGIPLAIKLAAARMPDLFSAALLKDLVRRPNALEADTAAVTGPGRHQALSAALDWSWQLLEPWEQTALAQCSVFHGGFDLEAADAVIDLTAHPGAPWVVDVLQALKEKSLLRVWYAPEFPNEPRCRQYVSIRGFARRKLEERGLVVPAMERHSEFYTMFGIGWASAPGVEGLRRIRLDRNNILAAHRRLLAKDLEDGEVLQRAIDSALALRPVIEAEGRYDAYLGVLDQIVLRKEIKNANPATQARLLLTRGHVRTIRGALAEAEEDCRLAVELATTTNATIMKAEAMTQLGSTLAAGGRLDDAAGLLKQALRLHGESRNPGAQGRTLLHLGGVYSSLGDEERAVACYEKALPRMRTVQDALYEAHCLVHLGTLKHASGDQETARQHLERAITILRGIKAPRFEAYASASLGAALHEQGDLAAARELYRRSLLISREVGERRWESVSSAYMALINLQEGLPDRAQRMAERAVKLADKLGDRRWSVVLRGVAIAAEAMSGYPDVAVRLMEEAKAGGETIEEPALEPLLEVAQLYFLLGEGLQARTTLLKDSRLKEVRRGVRKIDRRIEVGRWSKIYSNRMDLVRMLLTTLRRAAE